MLSSQIWYLHHPDGSLKTKHPQEVCRCFGVQRMNYFILMMKRFDFILTDFPLLPKMMPIDCKGFQQIKKHFI